MFMARRDNNKDLFHSLSVTGCKNSPVIPALRLLVQIKLESSFQKIEYFCTIFNYELNFLCWFFRSSIQLYTTRKYGREIYHGVKQHSRAQPCVTAQECLFSGNWTDFFLFQKWFLEQLRYSRPKQMRMLKSISYVIHINVQKSCCQAAGNISSDGKYFGWIFLMPLLGNLYKIYLLICYYYYIKGFWLRFYLSLLCQGIYLKIIKRIPSLSLYAS